MKRSEILIAVLAALAVGVVALLTADGDQEDQAAPEQRRGAGQSQNLPADDGEHPGPAESGTPTCQEIDQAKSEVRGDLTGLTREARDSQKTLNGLETELRSYPEDRSLILPDLRSSRLEVLDYQRQIGDSQRKLRHLRNRARKEGCGS